MELPCSLDSEALRRSPDAANGGSPTGCSGNSGSLAPGGRGARYKLMPPAELPISRSPSIAVPPGLSPTSFLESPVLLSDAKVESSPTTGSFAERRMLHGSISSNHPSYPDRFGEKESSFFEFQTSPRPNLGTAEVNYTIKESMQVHRPSQTQSLALVPLIRSELTVSSSELTLSTPAKWVPSAAYPPDEVDSEESNQQGHPDTGIQATESDHKGTGPPVMSERLSDDGYNWRKYGQKHVKGSAFPRSYYKCTHPKCEVKKLFERSPNGHITEIIYRGTHDHPKPQPNQCVAGGIMMLIQGERSPKSHNVSPLTGETSSNIYCQTSDVIESKSTTRLSLAARNEDSVEGTASLSFRTRDEVDEDDPLSKRRRTDIGMLHVTPVIKPIREPRVVVQTLSEVDILDDGYRWRKYGQKVVRGNPNPRSYYKCTNAGCPVRKHVERASNDHKAVITTYEGKHNHDVPTARTSSHDMAATTTPAGPSRIGPQQGERISLDLGVGISSAAEARSPKLQSLRHTIHRQLVQNQIHLNKLNMEVLRATPISSYYCVENCGTTNYFRSTEDLRGGRGVDVPPLNHSYSYPQTMERVLTGPYTCLPQNQSR